MSILILALLMQAAETERPESKAVVARTNLPQLIREIEQSGRVLTLARRLDHHLRIAPGAPPILAFRFFEGRERGRFGGLDLVLDDAGH